MLELNKIHCGDCLELMKKLPDNSIDLIITSPPYNVGKNNMNYRAKFKYNGKADFRSDYQEWIFRCLDEMLRCSKLVFFNIQMLAKNKTTVLNIMSNYKDYLKDIIIWGKKNPPPAMERGVMNSSFEFILIFSKDKPDKRKFYRSDFRGNVSNLIMTAVHRNKYAKIHKAAFPEEIPEYIIENFTKEDDTVLDPFMGIGTTAVVCKRYKRNYIGFEIDQKFCEVARKRIEGVKVEKSLSAFQGSLPPTP